MMTVKQVSELTGVSVRTLQYYDRIGLLPPAEYTEAGYRLYDDSALERLQQVLLFRELEFPLKEIKSILESPAFDAMCLLEKVFGIGSRAQLAIHGGDIADEVLAREYLKLIDKRLHEVHTDRTDLMKLMLESATTDESILVCVDEPFG